MDVIAPARQDVTRSTWKALRRADGSIPWPADTQIDHWMEHRHLERDWLVRGYYAVADGPTFVSEYRWPNAEHTRYSIDKAMRMVYRALVAQVNAHNAAIQPVPNGPDEVVALVETCTRVEMAREALDIARAAPTFGRPRGIVAATTEFMAACKANAAAADGAVRFFITSHINHQRTNP